MFLKSLKLRNIRCFSEASVDFDLEGGRNRKWTILLGENGTGKSTVLKSVALALLGSEALTEHLADPSEWIKGGCDQGSIKLEFETSEGLARSVELDFQRGETTLNFLKRNAAALEPLDSALTHATRNYLTIAYGASRRLNSTVSPSSPTTIYRNPRARSMASLFDRQAELNSIEGWAMQLDYRSDGAAIGVITKSLSDFLPEMEFSRIDKEKNALLFHTIDGEISLRQLSDGFQNVAAWVGDLLFQVTEIFKDFKEPLKARALLIIDEVDLHLHPKWQRQLQKFLNDKMPNMQLLVTTHSVVTAQQAEPGALHYCVRRGKDVVVEQFSGDPRTMLLNQLLATEAFGNASDESVRTENEKNRYRELHRKETKTEDDRREMAAISSKLTNTPENEKEVGYLNPDQREIVRKLEEQLRKVAP
jgi:predicted ATPase